MFRFWILISLCSYLYKCQACCWYVWELLDTILKEEALFFTSLSNRSNSSGAGYTLEVCVF